MMNAQWQEHTDPRVSFINPELSLFGGFSVHKKNYAPIMKAGREAAEKFLKEKTGLASFFLYLHRTKRL